MSYVETPISTPDIDDWPVHDWPDADVPDSPDEIPEPGFVPFVEPEPVYEPEPRRGC